MIDRANGRTHRLALKACLLASEGKKVTFIYGNHMEMQYIFQQIMDISSTVMATCSMMHHTVRYPGGGSIDLVSAHSCHKGKYYPIIMMDELNGLNWRHIERLTKTLGNPHITT
jgi:hypothetical protein